MRSCFVEEDKDPVHSRSSQFFKTNDPKMFQAGMNGVRINTAYGNLAQYQSIIETVREIVDIPIVIARMRIPKFV
jgi:hypothetical protein